VAACDSGDTRGMLVPPGWGRGESVPLNSERSPVTMFNLKLLASRFFAMPRSLACERSRFKLERNQLPLESSIRRFFESHRSPAHRTIRVPAPPKPLQPPYPSCGLLGSQPLECASDRFKRRRRKSRSRAEPAVCIPDGSPDRARESASAAQCRFDRNFRSDIVPDVPGRARSRLHSLVLVWRGSEESPPVAYTGKSFLGNSGGTHPEKALPIQDLPARTSVIGKAIKWRSGIHGAKVQTGDGNIRLVTADARTEDISAWPMRL
jgi:hypothetical protein